VQSVDTRVHGKLRQALLSPRSVALVGQSNDAGKTAGRPLKFLRQIGYQGRIYPINARRDEVLGERAWPSLTALPEVPEHVYIVTPTDAAVAAIEDCGKAGVQVATVLADGFAEAGPEGERREARLRKVCADTRLRIVGPSSLGVVNLRDKVLLTANAAFAEPDMPVGRVFVASHSGSMIGAMMSRGKARGIGFAGFVSVGNEVDLSLGEVCAATLDDPDIDGYLLFLETMRHADTLRAFALEAAARGKPIVAYKLGRTERARELAVSHTGAIAGEDDVADTLLKECGIARVDTFEGLIESVPLLTHVPLRKREARTPTVGVMTTTAGGATMVIDALAARGVTVEIASEATRAKLAAAGIEAHASPLLDLTIAGTRYDVAKAALDILRAAPEFDLVLPVVGSSARYYPEQAVQPILDCARDGKPVAAFLVPDAPEALARLSAAEVPNFRTPEACADAVAAILLRREPRPQLARTIPPWRRPGVVLNELASYGMLDRLGIMRVPALALNVEITKVPALPFAYPVAVKVLTADVAHKSDIGGVSLGVADADDLLTSIARMRGVVAQHGHVLQRVLVQPMTSGVGEVLIGYRVDRDVGPLVMLAAGGLLAEIHKEHTLRLAPIDLEEARAMIGELPALRVLQGYRGKPAGDLEAVADALVKLSQMADHPNVSEAEINPLIVRARGEGVVAVDALVRLAAKD
jgi:acyl-CoA synthetase (NDP forming)